MYPTLLLRFLYGGTLALFSKQYYVSRKHTMNNWMKTYELIICHKSNTTIVATNTKHTQYAITYPDTPLWDRICTDNIRHSSCIFIEFSVRLLHLSSPLLFLFSCNSSLCLFFFLVGYSAGIIAGGGPDCNPPTCTVQAAPTDRASPSLSLSDVGVSLISAAIRAAGRKVVGGVCERRRRWGG